MIEEGVYFNLSEGDYHADLALGSGDHKRVLTNAVQFQFARLSEVRADLGLEPEADEREKPHLIFGKAVHKIVLEGPEAFEAAYAEALDYPNELTIGTVAQIKEAVRLLMADGEKMPLPAAALKADWLREARVRGIGKGWHLGLLNDDLEALNREHIGEREELSKRWASTIRLIGRLLDAPSNMHGGKSVRQRVLTDGMPEVSVFWTDEESGVRCKCRYDWLRPKAIVDLKTHMAREDQDTVTAFCNSVARYAYGMQEEHYVDGRGQVARLVAEGRVFGDHDPKWLKRVAAFTDRPAWYWLAIQTAGMPEVDVLELADPSLMNASYWMVREARRRYAEFRDRYGEDQVWVADRGELKLTEAAFPPWARNLGTETWRTAQGEGT